MNINHNPYLSSAASGASSYAPMSRIRSLNEAGTIREGGEALGERTNTELLDDLGVKDAKTFGGGFCAPNIQCNPFCPDCDLHL